MWTLYIFFKYILFVIYWADDILTTHIHLTPTTPRQSPSKDKLYAT